MAGDELSEFSELLGRLKERSGLSYGVLGKRLHTSASTLHRYVNGDAVPTDYAPVERFARACKATPEELVELHRRWVLADARRRQKASGAPAEEEPQARTAAEARTEADVKTGAAEAEATAEATPEVERWPLTEAPVARRRRTVVLAGAAVAAALVATALVVNLVPDEGDDGQGGTGAVGAASPSADKSPGASKPSDAKGKSASPSASRSGSPTVSPSASASRSGGAGAEDGAGTGADQGGGAEDGATAPSVVVDPYEWEGPCSQHYLVDKEPEQVVPPPSESEARGWVNALGAVAGGQQMLELTVQGTGSATVVLDELHVRVVEKSAPLDWNDFAMGVGCGGNVDTKAFKVDLDAGRPAISPKAGQRDFPYKVSQSDPEVFYVFADARAHNVSWYLELDWSSGDKQGTVRLDDNGNPFRTSGNVGQPAYNYQLSSSEWARDEWDPNIPG